MTSDLIIENCEERFTKMVNELYLAYKAGLKFQFEANFPGNVNNNFKYHFGKLNPEELYQLIIKANGEKNGQT